MESTLIGKIAKAALDVGGKLGADKRNKEQNYDYVSADKILAVSGQALSNQGVVVLPAVVTKELILVDYVSRSGGKGQRWDALVEFDFCITDGTTELHQHWFGMGSDYSVPDKALYKALTSGHKYYLAKLLCIGAGNEDAEHDEQEKPAQQQPAPVSANAEKPAQIETWDEAVLDALAQNLGAAKPRLTATLKYCNLPKSSPIEVMSVWMQNYKAHRDAGEQPAIAAESANVAMQEELPG